MSPTDGLEPISPWYRRERGGTSFFSDRPTSTFISCYFTGITSVHGYIWLWRWQIRYRMKRKSAFPFIITWILEAVPDSCRRRRRRRRRCRARPVGGRRRSGSASLAVQPCPGRQLRSRGQSPRGASIPAYGRRWRERA